MADIREYIPFLSPGQSPCHPVGPRFEIVSEGSFWKSSAAHRTVEMFSAYGTDLSLQRVNLKK